ncbi:MAG: hypothetical protein ACRELD_08310 [Longimicrobiales bacterium]
MPAEPVPAEPVPAEAEEPGDTVLGTPVELPEPDPLPPPELEPGPAEPEPGPPVAAAARPPVLPGSVLPARRIIAFYGNPRSTRMGILGELPPERMLARLDTIAAAWRRADPRTPVQPALHLIAVMAASDPGPDDKYRVRMPRRVIEDVMSWAKRRDALVFLDIQPGRSTVREELPKLLEYLRSPYVHLALDPEWSMQGGAIPGQRIGTMDAADINHAIEALARLVEEHDLPPKVLVVHRFTRGMVTNVGRIEDDPRVQVVLNMDGWGAPSLKRASYRSFVASAPIPYKGFKVFFHNDRRSGSRLMLPAEILALTPAPIYIQYQ